MRKYDSTFIIDGTLSESERETIIAKTEDLLKSKGAVIERTVRWGLRQLAYEVNGRMQGYYVIIYFEADPSILSSYHHEFDLNENILRYMTMIFEGTHPSYIRDETTDSQETSSTTAVTEEVKKESVEDGESDKDSDGDDENGEESGSDDEDGGDDTASEAPADDENDENDEDKE